MKLSLIYSLALSLCLSVAEAKPETYSVDSAGSNLNWTGKKITGEHHGSLSVKSGSLSIVKGQLQTGEVLIDMSSLKVIDVTDAEQNKKLSDHLRSEDFFSVEKFPVATLKISKVENGTTPGSINISGDLTIKGISQPISFPASFKSGKNSFEADAKISIDRTKYDIKYRSGKFFPELGDKVIKDEFLVDTHLVSKK